MRSGVPSNRLIRQDCRRIRTSGCGDSIPAAVPASCIARGVCRATGSWLIRIASSTSPHEAKEQIEQVCRIGGNVLAYATNRQLKEKLERPQVDIGNLTGKTPRGSLTIPKLSHGGGADDAPNALLNLLTVMDKQLQMKVDYERRPPIAANEPKLLDYPLMFAHGRQAFQFTNVERKALKTYLDRGGFLFADAICASDEFATPSARNCTRFIPTAKFTRLPARHPLFTDRVPRLRS